MGLRVSQPCKIFAEDRRDLQAKGYFHRITVATSLGPVQHLVLYPISFSTIDWSKVQRPPGIHKTASRTRPAIYVPRKAAARDGYATFFMPLRQAEVISSNFRGRLGDFCLLILIRSN